MSESKQRAKYASEATDEENAVPGSHGPASERSLMIMSAITDIIKEMYPDVELAVFVFEEGRYNYAATVDRDDMVAVLRGFIARHEEAKAIDEAIGRPSEGSA